MENKFKLSAIYKIPLGVLAILIVIWQLCRSWGTPGFRIPDYFSLFTIIANLFGATILILSSYKFKDKTNTKFDYLRGMNSSYLLIVGIVYYALIANSGGYTYLTIYNSNIILHRVMPLVLLLDFAIDRPIHKFQYKKTLTWLIIPLVYVTYSLIRGPIVKWYPYDFLNPKIENGYLGVSLYCLGITIGFIVFGFGLYYLCNCKRKNADY